MNRIFELLEFNTILKKLEEFAYTERGKEKIRGLMPSLRKMDVKVALRETTEAREMLDKLGNPPLVSLDQVEEFLNTAEKEGCLTAEQLEYIAITLTAVQRLKDYLCRGKHLESGLPFYESDLFPMADIKEELTAAVRNNQVQDNASKFLKDTREQITRTEEKMRLKAESVLKANKEAVSDHFITSRNGRICIPVKKDYKFRIPGTVIDKSSTGATLFVEPSSVAKYGEELQLLKLDEENEVRRVLYTLTSMIADQKDLFYQNIRVIEKLDFIFAKGKLSEALDGRRPSVNLERRIRIRNGRHPLLNREQCIPLNFEIGGETRGIIITGPNTGGKTVAIKTVGLYSLMAQCGLHLPCEDADICMNSQVLCDIGDGQNMTENLSTFSAHITNALDILKRVNRESLVVMDELGSGTDPAEGMGIAVAILEELRKSGCLFLVTTHYPEVKQYGESAEGVLNARMAFDRETLKPKYRLEIGQAGESCAFYIAKSLGMPDDMLYRAGLAAYGEHGAPGRLGEDGLVAAGQLWEEKPEGREHTAHRGGPAIQKEKAHRKQNPIGGEFRLGDCVMVYPDKKTGIVCRTANEKGVLQVQLQDKKIWINHKRIKLHVPAAKLYPEDYDFSIIFETVEERKAKHQMGRKYCGDLERTVSEPG